MTVPTASADAALRLVRGESAVPHDLLGAHPITVEGVDGVAIRAFQPNAASIAVVLGEQRWPMERDAHGLFALFLSDRTAPVAYRLEVTFGDGRVVLRDDPYRFLPTLGEMDLHLFNEGRHLRLWEKLGAHVCEIDGVAGTSFAVWAPNATRVSVIGAFNGWDGRAHQMRLLGASGVFELFVPGVGADALYKFEIRSPTGSLRVKTDPYAFAMEQGPGHASIVQAVGTYDWKDGAWLAQRADADPLREPMLVYEVHLSSWMRGEHNRLLTYRELAPRLAEHVKRMGFTHIELLPVLEHPFGGSWGYQVGGYFAPTSRHGSPDDFRAFVDTMHEAGIGVLLDWVPAHFPKDDWALRRFDGTACYEHEDPRLGDHPEWGTHIFNYARYEVRNFLLANALYWIEEFHIDGLRVDAVASMLYLDYGREAGQWLRNRFGGRENLEAVSFLKQLNHAVHSLHPGVITVAEESTSWPRVTHPISEGGLGFTLKWNMGWMHDTLDYFKVDPFFRKGAHDKLTFAMMYEYSERFMNPLSHDEVVHLKQSLLEKMPGDIWQRFANLRALIGYSITRPGKSLFFMGTELGSHHEWNHDISLEWHLLGDARRQGLLAFMQAVGALYRQHSCFWRRDHEPSGFGWIDVSDKEQSVLAYGRYDGSTHAMVVLNLTPVPRAAYRLGAPSMGTYHVVLNSDATTFGGSGYEVAEAVEAEPVPYHGFSQSVTVSLPPMSILVMLPAEQPDARAVVDVLAELVVENAAALRSGAGKSRSKKDKPAKAPKPEKAPKAEKAPKPLKAEKAEKAEKAPKPPKAPKPEKAPKPPKAPKEAKAAKPAKPSKSAKAAKQPKVPTAAKAVEPMKQPVATPARKTTTRARKAAAKTSSSPAVRKRTPVSPVPGPSNKKPVTPKSPPPATET